MRHTILLPALLFSVCSYSQTFEIINKTDTINRTDKKGRKQGKWIEFYGENGRSEYFYKDDKKEGEYFWYDKNNIISETGFYKHGKPEGVSRVFQNGKLSSTSIYKHGIRILRSIDYYANGQPTTGGDYYRGNGVFITYDSSGFVISSYTYKNDKRHGPFEIYYQNKQLKEKGVFRKDKYWTIENRFDSLGGKLNFGNIKSGTGEVVCIDENGEVTRYETYKSGRLWKVLRPIIKPKDYGDLGNFKDGNGLLKEYDSPGNLIREKTYRNGLLNGVFREYVPIIKAVFAGNCINDNREGEWLRYVNVRLRNVITYRKNQQWE